MLLLGGDNRILHVNAAAEQLLGTGRRQLLGRRLDRLLPADSPLPELLREVRERDGGLSEYGVEWKLPRGTDQAVDVHLTPLEPSSEQVLVMLHPRARAEAYFLHPQATVPSRAAAALASTLAHEVRNPLSGIRGSAQLLEGSVAEEDRSLLELIVEETDRICRLLDEVEVFADIAPLRRAPVNIHVVLDHVRRVAESGFARHVRIEEAYDPSLPPVAGDRDRLVQLFLNLIKNAAEAVPRRGGRILLSTRYRHDMRIGEGAVGRRRALPIVVDVRDNGPGIPEELRPCLFDPFVSGRSGGRGLGLALARKIASDHGGTLTCHDAGPGTIFRVRLPSVEGDEGAAA